MAHKQLPPIISPEEWRLDSSVDPSSLRFQLIGDDEIEHIPMPEQLVEGILLKKSLNELFGKPGTGKSLLALDLSMHVALGLSWFGHEVVQGPVIYIAAERAHSLPARVEAWKDAHHVTGQAGVLFVRESTQLFQGDDPQRLLETLRHVLPAPPVLLVFDTRFRCSDGAQENDASDIGAVVKNLDWLRETTGAAELTLHHPNASGYKERGSTVFRGAADGMLKLTASGDILTLESDKANDLAPFAPIKMRRVSHLDSAILEPIDGIVGPQKKKIPARQKEILRALRETYGSQSATNTDWFQACKTKNPVLAESTFNQCRKVLVEYGYVAKQELSGSGPCYSITETGLLELGVTLPTPNSNGAQN